MKWAQAHFLFSSPVFTDGKLMSQAQREQLLAMLEPEIEQLGYELFDLEVNVAASGGLLRLFIDADDGISLEDCAAVSRQVSAVLDVEDPIPGEYSLEVSSPGMNRRLVKEVHFKRFAGSRVKVKLKRLYEGRRNFKARLLGYEKPNVLLQEGKETFSIPLQEVDTARVVPKF
jgi:ribosome maturation factor RimP